MIRTTTFLTVLALFGNGCSAVDTQGLRGGNDRQRGLSHAPPRTVPMGRSVDYTCSIRDRSTCHYEASDWESARGGSKTGSLTVCLLAGGCEVSCAKACALVARVPDATPTQTITATASVTSNKSPKNNRRSRSLQKVITIPIISEMCYTPKITSTIADRSIRTHVEYLRDGNAAASAQGLTESKQELRKLLNANAGVFADSLFDALQEKNVQRCHLSSPSGSSSKSTVNITCYADEICYAPAN